MVVILEVLSRSVYFVMSSEHVMIKIYENFVYILDFDVFQNIKYMYIPYVPTFFINIIFTLYRNCTVIEIYTIEGKIITF